MSQVSETKPDSLKNGTKTHSGMFQPGNPGGPGRPKGAKNKVTKLFIDDITHEWRNRGAQALQELTGKELVQACIAILPKDVLVSLQADDVNWVINAAPRLSKQEWIEKHDLNSAPMEHGAIEHDDKQGNSKG